MVVVARSLLLVLIQKTIFFVHRMSSKSTVKVKRRQWSDDDMISAIESVRTGNLTITVAASRFNVPRRSLDDRLKGHVVHGVKPGVSTVLSAEEESSLVYYLLHMAECGFPLTRTMVKAYAWSLAKRMGSGHRFHPEYGPGGPCLRSDIQSCPFVKLIVWREVGLVLSIRK